MAAHMVFWTLQLILIEKGCYNCCRREPNKEVSQEACDLDDDVKMEEVRVIGMANKDIISVQEFKKVYSVTS
jgi:hypothetical protein